MNRNHFEQVHGAYYFVWRWTNFNTLSSCFFFLLLLCSFFCFVSHEIGARVNIERRWLMSLLHFAVFSLARFFFIWKHFNQVHIAICFVFFVHVWFSVSLYAKNGTTWYRWSIEFWSRFWLCMRIFFVISPHLTSIELALFMKEDDFLKTIARWVNVLQMIYFFPRCNFWVLLSTILRSNISAFETCIFH